MKKSILHSSIYYCILFFALCINSSLTIATSSSQASPQENGIIPKVSDHYRLEPAVYDFDNMPAEHISDTISRRFILSSQSSLVRWDFKKDTKLPTHFHVNEQVTYVAKGVLEVHSQGKKYIIKAGQVITVPPNVPHEFIVLADTTIYEFHAPARQDFINGDFEKTIGTALHPPK